MQPDPFDLIAFCQVLKKGRLGNSRNAVVMELSGRCKEKGKSEGNLGTSTFSRRVAEERDHAGTRARLKAPYRPGVAPIDVNSPNENGAKTRAGQVYTPRPRLAVVLQ